MSCAQHVTTYASQLNFGLNPYEQIANLRGEMAHYETDQGLNGTGVAKIVNWDH
jgi:hypothetical protein